MYNLVFLCGIIFLIFFDVLSKLCIFNFLISDRICLWIMVKGFFFRLFDFEDDMEGGVVGLLFRGCRDLGFLMEFFLIFVLLSFFFKFCFVEFELREGLVLKFFWVEFSRFFLLFLVIIIK